MINWQRTFEVYGIKEVSRIAKKQKLIVCCDFCNVEAAKTKQEHYQFVRLYGHYRCRQCSNKLSHDCRSLAAKEMHKRPEYAAKQKARRHTEELKESARKRALELWKDPEYVKKFNDGFDPIVAKLNLSLASEASRAISSMCLKEKWQSGDYRSIMSQQSKSLWSDPNYRHRVVTGLKEHYSDPEVRHEIGLKAEAIWADADRRKRLSQSLKEKWKDEDYRLKCAIARNNRPNGSSQEDLVAFILESYGIRFERHFVIGPWEFDFLLLDSNLLVEVDSLYWHRHRLALDKSKATYVAKHTNYRLHVLRETDFMAERKLSQIFNMAVNVVDVDFSKLQFYQCLRDEAYDLLSAFHYLGRPTRSGRYFAIKTNNDLVAAAILSPPHRVEIATSIGLQHKNVLEISRLAINPSFQVHNLGSWFISKICKFIRKNKLADAVVAFADTGIHRGTVYVSSNFKDVGISRSSDYEYVDQDGYRIHKKTVWDAAKKNGMSENDYATQANLTKVIVAPRRKFVYFIK